MQNLYGASLQYESLTSCGGCGSTSLFEAYNFGEVPIAGHFPLKAEDVLPLVPMSLMFCSDCTLVQISPNLDDNYLFSDYRYISSVGMKSHFTELAQWFITREAPEKGARILEIGCNDGPLLQCLSDLGFSPMGIDPAKNIVEKARKSGLNVINDFFNESALEKYNELRGVDYIFSSNSFAHISDIKSIAKSISIALSNKGKFVVEVQSFVELVKKNAFDFVYHEHKYYYTINSISRMMSQYGLHLEHCELIDIHGGSYRFIFSKEEKSLTSDLLDLIRSEEEMSLDPGAINDAVKRYTQALENFDSYFESKKLENKKIVAFGASGRANMLLAHLPKIRSAIPFIIDESTERIGRNMAQDLVPIRAFSSEQLYDFDVVLILAWNFSETIINKWTNKVDIEFGIPLPEFRKVMLQEDNR
jgi:hypothetical protein